MESNTWTLLVTAHDIGFKHSYEPQLKREALLCGVHLSDLLVVAVCPCGSSPQLIPNTPILQWPSSLLPLTHN